MAEEAGSGARVSLRIQGGVARIGLDRPDKLNAIDAAMHADLRRALDTVEAADGVGALVLTGEGRAFCAGQDLTEALGPDGTVPDLGPSLDRDYNPLVRRLTTFPVPVVAAVSGIAAGAGANIALACDLVVAGRSARFVQAFVHIGLVPDCGGTHFLVQRLGAARALGLMLTGEPVDGAEAERIGLIYRAVDDATVEGEAMRLASALAAGPTVALRLIRQAVRGALFNDLDAQLDLERDLQREAGRTADFREGLAAFREKRPPRFAGR